MNSDVVRRAMEKYKTAWETQDAELILECFTEDATYQESPLGKQLRGHEEIKNYWLSEPCSRQEDIHFEFDDVKISNETAFVEWRCELRRPKGNTKIMAGIMILKMEGERISHLNEYWNVEEDLQ